MKEALSLLAIALTIYAYWPYITSIRRGETKPHIFSWIIWGVATLVVFFAQLAGDGGVGAWPIGVSGIITFYVAFLAYQNRGDFKITRLDWIFFITALSSLPIWYFTSDPLWAVIILTTVDTLGFAPTIRKSYLNPFSEQLQLYVIMTIRNIVAVFALETYSVTTILFPGVMAVTCALFIAMIIYRRHVVGKSGAPVRN